MRMVQVTADIDGAEVGFYHKQDAGVDFVFVDHPSYRRPGGLYGDANGVYGDNQWCAAGRATPCVSSTFFCLFLSLLWLLLG